MNSNLGRFEAIIFDMDGTLTQEVSSWAYLHSHFGTNLEARKNLDEYSNWKISYAEFMRRDISLWPRPLKISEVERLLQGVQVSTGARELIEFLSPRLKCLVISAGIDLLADRIARALGIKNSVANGLEFNETGTLTGQGIERVPLNGKAAAAKSLLQKEEVDWNRCIAVGDSHYDRDLLQSAGLSVSVGKDAKLMEMAMLRVSGLEKLLEIISKLQFG